MRLTILVCLASLILPLTAAAQLTPDQEVLFADLQGAFERREDWESYAQTAALTTHLAWTVNGNETNLWSTTRAGYNFEGEVDRMEGLLGGQGSSMRVENNPEGATRTDNQFEVIVNPDGFFTRADSDEFTEAEADDYALYALDPTTHLISADLLNGVTAIYDLGIQEGLQGYQVQLGFGESLPHLPQFNPDDFLDNMNGVVELGFVRESLAESSTVTLIAYLDYATGQVVSLTLIVEIALQVEGENVVIAPEGEAIFAVDYSWTQSVSYRDLNEPVTIPAP